MPNVGPFSQHNVTRRTISDGYIDSMLTADFDTHYQLIKTLGLTRGGGINVRVRPRARTWFGKDPKTTYSW